MMGGPMESPNNGAVEMVASSPATMAILAGIPTVGGAIAAFLSTHGQNIQRRRFDRAISALEGRVNDFEARASKLEEGELYDAILAYAEASARIDSQVMQGIAADILMGRLSMDSAPERPVQRSLKLASELLPIELELCRAIHSAGSSKPEDLGDLTELGPEDVRAWCQAIAPTGLLSEAVGLGGWGHFRPTAPLNDLMDFLSSARDGGSTNNEPSIAG